jgi:hypothetical protein
MADRNRTRAEIADVEAATAIASISFDAIYHNAVISRRAAPTLL